MGPDEEEEPAKRVPNRPKRDRRKSRFILRGWRDFGLELIKSKQKRGIHFLDFAFKLECRKFCARFNRFLNYQNCVT